MSQTLQQKKTVSGYCHQLLTTNIRIPSDIISLCYAFYALPDEWDTAKKSDKIIIYDHLKHQNVLARYPPPIDVRQLGKLATVFGRKTVSPNSGIHEWILRIVESKNSHTNYSLVIGVTKNHFIEECIHEPKGSSKHPGGTGAIHRLPVAFMRFNGIDRGYGFVANRGCKMKQLNQNDHRLWKYGVRIRECNEIMRVVLDMDEYTLSYVINGKEYGIAFDVDKECEYRLAVCMLPGMMVELCDMEEGRTKCSEIKLIRHDQVSLMGQLMTWKYAMAMIVVLIGVAVAWYLSK